SAIPVKFSLGGDQGLDILADGYPLSQPIACDAGAQLDQIEDTVKAGGSSLTYDPVTEQYNYIWKTDRS
ncbi:MAG TPA: PxKF domain-containing protein, partial [Gemmatimonadales bacterium]|nr:PxKF domain-containing protein [Gemmatimonadales bacterium]